MAGQVRRAWSRTSKGAPPDPKMVKGGGQGRGPVVRDGGGASARCSDFANPCQSLPAFRARSLDGAVAEEGSAGRCNCRAIRGRRCATSAKGRGGPNVCNCLIDEGRPLGTG